MLDVRYICPKLRKVAGWQKRETEPNYDEIIVLNGKRWRVTKSIDDYELYQASGWKSLDTVVEPIE